MPWTWAGTTITQTNETAQTVTGAAPHADGTILTCAGHGLAVGDWVRVAGTTSYDGAALVRAISTDTFRIDRPFVGDATGTVARGDKDLSGLAGRSGVNRIQVGRTAGGDLQRSWYFVTSRSLVVQGDLRIDPKAEHLIMRHDALANDSDQDFIQIQGRVEIGEEDELVGEVLQTLTRTERHWASFAVQVLAGGHLVWRGASVVGANPGIYATHGGRLTIRRGRVHAAVGSGYQTEDVPAYVGGDAQSLIDIDGLDLVGRCQIVASTEISGLVFRDGASGEIFSGMVLRDCTVDDPAQVVLLAWRRSGVVRNWGRGSNLHVRPGTATRAIAVEVRRDVNVRLTDLDGTAVEGAQVRIADTDHSHRASDVTSTVQATSTAEQVIVPAADASSFLEGAFVRIAGETRRIATRNNSILTLDDDLTAAPSAGDSVDLVLSDGAPPSEDRVYTGATGADGTLAANLDVLIAHVSIGSGQPDYDTGAGRIDRRAKSETAASTANTDLFDVGLAHYNFAFAAVEASLVGTGTLEVPRVMLPDPLITEADKATVDALTEITTAAQFYDRAKAHWIDHFAGETSLPITREGTLIDLGARDLTIDSTAAAAWAVAADGSITIKATTWTGSLRTTGTVTLSGATVHGHVEDAGGITARVTVTAGAADTIELFAADGTSRGTGTGTLVVGLTAEQIEAGQKVVVARAGWDAQSRTLDTSAGGVFQVRFDPLRQNTQPDGSVSLSATPTAGVSLTLDATDLFAPTLVVDVPDEQMLVQNLWSAIVTELSTTEDGRKYLAFGGRAPTAILSPAADTMYLPEAIQLSTMTGSRNCQVIGNVIHEGDTSPIADASGIITLVAGLNLEAVAQAIATDYDLDPATVGTQSIAGQLLAIAQELITADIDSIRDGVQTYASELVDVRNDLEHATTGLPALKALIDALPSATAEAVRQIEVETSVDVRAALQLLLSGLLGTTAVDTDAEGRARVTFRRLDAAATDAVAVSLGDDDGEREEVDVL